jgi:RNA polymerase sigma-70 factor, ECF subfamily
MQRSRGFLIEPKWGRLLRKLICPLNPYLAVGYKLRCRDGVDAQMSESVTRSSAGEVSQLLKDWGSGDENALNKLIPLVYEELHKMARQQMARERGGHTLQATALVNEVYLRLLGAMEVSFDDRAHFFALCAQLMRRLLIDHARARGRAKRGGAMKKLSLEESFAIPVGHDSNILELDDALNALAAADERKAKIVELRFFGGFSVEETAKALKVSVSTVMNDWKFAKVWLLREMQRGHEEDES